MHLDRPFGEAAVPVFTWTNQLPFAAKSNQAIRALGMNGDAGPGRDIIYEKRWQKFFHDKCGCYEAVKLRLLIIV